MDLRPNTPITEDERFKSVIIFILRLFAFIMVFALVLIPLFMVLQYLSFKG